jgi:hypothetical protein
MVSSIIDFYAGFFLMNHREHRGKEEKKKAEMFASPVRILMAGWLQEKASLIGDLP